MYYYSIDQIITKTANTLSIPEHKVRQVLKHTFRTLRKEFYRPSSPAYFLEDFGNFTITPHRLRTSFNKVLLLYRKDNAPSLLERLHSYASIRSKVSAYFQSRKYKKRFGSWHWKPTTQHEATDV